MLSYLHIKMQLHRKIHKVMGTIFFYVLQPPSNQRPSASGVFGGNIGPWHPLAKIFDFFLRNLLRHYIVAW